MRNISKKRPTKIITAQAFDDLFDQGQDVSKFLDFKKATVVKRVNVDFPAWMVDFLDREATKLNVSRQAIIKMWINDRLEPASHTHNLQA